MKCMNSLFFASLLILLVCAGPAPAASRAAADFGQWEELKLSSGEVMPYYLVLPENFDPSKAYPALLALPPVRMDKAGVEEGMSKWWGYQAKSRGWIVVSPMKVGGLSFFHGSENHIPDLLNAIGLKYKIEGGKFHLAGSSASGRGAFRVATLYPHYFASLTAHPGYPVIPADEERLPALRDLSVYFFCGGEDHPWIRKSEKTHETLLGLGIDSHIRIFPGEKHAPVSLEGDAFMEHMDAVRAHRRGWADVRQVNAVLDNLHDAADKADGARYFSVFAPDAVFLGTDPGERWTLDEFRTYAMPHFEAGSAWSYTVKERHVNVNQTRTTAWFDESLLNEKYGECRGSGVLTKTEKGWVIAQYNLSLVVPNAVAPLVVDIIRNKRMQSP